MMDNGIPDPPEGTRETGLRLWRAILSEYVLEQHELQLLTALVRTADQLDELDAIVRREGVLTPDGKAHPALVESRQQRIALARLSAALRLPSGEPGDEKRGARRPQRRSGVRGVYLGGMIA